MKSIRVLTVVSLGLLAGFLSNPLKADDFNKETIVKIDNPMQVANVVLAPGKYDFQLAQTQTPQPVVYIRDANDYHLVATVFGNAAYRPVPHGKAGWTFYPSQPGQVAALKTWYFAGENDGIQFRDYKAPAATLAKNPGSNSTGAVGGMK
jgi:hypothetical protein